MTMIVFQKGVRLVQGGARASTFFFHHQNLVLPRFTLLNGCLVFFLFLLVGEVIVRSFSNKKSTKDQSSSITLVGKKALHELDMENLIERKSCAFF